MGEEGSQIPLFQVFHYQIGFKNKIGLTKNVSHRDYVKRPFAFVIHFLLVFYVLIFRHATKLKNLLTTQVN